MQKKTKNKNASKSKEGKKPVWNLGLLYASPNDPQIEKNFQNLEKICSDFAQKYDSPEKVYIKDENVLFDALTEYENIARESDTKAILYFYYLRDIDGNNAEAASKVSLYENRIAKISNVITFFGVHLSKIDAKRQQELLKSPKLGHFRVFLKRVFDDGKYTLTVDEEKILNLKSLPAQEMWIAGNQKALSGKSITFKGKKMPLSQVNDLIPSLPSAADRKKLTRLFTDSLKSIAPFAEAEMNAVITNKKIDDELRGYEKPFSATVQGYRNDPKVIELLIKTVTDNFSIPHKFFKLKAKILKLKKLSYSDRGAKIGKAKGTYSFDESFKKLSDEFGKLNPRFSQILGEYVKNGQIDVHPRQGKKGGAYCWGSVGNPTFVLLNHIDTLYSFTTFAHEMGHAFHTELSKSQTPLYMNYSTSLAETASTLFEGIALESVFEKLSDKEKIIVLHDKINDDIATIFRQVACFNFENELHNEVRAKGYLPAEEMARLHNKNIGAYLGDAVTMDADDGYFFVWWSHIRRFFYVYSYAYGQLVSKALLARYRKDPKFWTSIEKFLSAGGKASPEEILKEIGIDIHHPQFFMDALKEVERDILLLEKLTMKSATKK